MGHMRIGTLPTGRKWREIVAYLEEADSDAGELARRIFAAAKGELENASSDPGLWRAFHLLARLTSTAREKDALADALRACGMRTGAEFTPLDIASAFTEALDGELRDGGRRNDLSEMAQLAAAKALQRSLAERTQSFFGATEEEMRHALRALGTKASFGVLVREAFAELTYRFLAWHVTREIANQVGPGRRFERIEDRADFSDALRRHCWESNEIVEIFAGSWFSDSVFREGITEQRARWFVKKAVRKLADELTKRSEAA